MIKETSKTSQLTEIIGKKIINSDFSCGDMFSSENSLALEYQVSRGVIREVLQGLAEKGLIEKKMHSCWRVCSADDWNLFDDDLIDWCLSDNNNHELYLQFNEFRKEIEPKAIELAAVRCTDKDLQILREIYEQMKQSTNSQELFCKADVLFHQYLFKATQNRVFFKIGKSVSKLLQYSIVKTYRQNKEEMIETLADHYEILQALEKHNPIMAKDTVLKIIFKASELIKGSD